MNKSRSYIATLDKTKKKQLDKLIDKFELPIASIAYIDILTPRDRYTDFISDLTDIGLAINSISWWCHVTEKKQLGCPHGMGGPQTKFGWFSEIVHEFDEIDNDFGTVKEINNKALEIIETKQTKPYADGTILTFEKSHCLTPGLWLHVPEEWIRR